MTGLDPTTLRDMRKLAERISKLEKDARRDRRTGQLAHSSIDGGALTAFDGDGMLRSVIGKQNDGSYTHVDFNGAAPPMPGTPNVDVRPGGVVVVTSYGLTATGEDWPADFLRIDVHAGASGFTPNIATKVGEFTRDGGLLTLALDPGTPDWAVRLVAVNTSGVESQPTAEILANSLDVTLTPDPAFATGLLRVKMLLPGVVLAAGYLNVVTTYSGALDTGMQVPEALSPSQDVFTGGNYYASSTQAQYSYRIAASDGAITFDQTGSPTFFSVLNVIWLTV